MQNTWGQPHIQFLLKISTTFYMKFTSWDSIELKAAKTPKILQNPIKYMHMIERLSKDVTNHKKLQVGDGKF